MQHDFKLQTSGSSLIVALLGGLAFCSVSGLALTEANPYAAIAGRNVFALKPPPPPSTANTLPPAPPAGIELQGFTTILGRPQVLLKVKIPAKPPEPAKDRSLVMDVGQREGEVEVIEMDAYAGIVKLKNQGNPLSLNLKDNATKPAAGPALAATAMASMPGVIPPPTPSTASSAGLGGASVSPFGASGSAASAPNPRVNLPTRNLRAGGVNPQAGQNDATSLPLDAQVALIEVERERTRAAVEAGKMPPLPPMNLSK